MINMLSTNYNFINSDNSEQASYIPGLLQNMKESDNDIFSVYFGTTDGKYPNIS